MDDGGVRVLGVPELVAGLGDLTGNIDRGADEELVLVAERTAQVVRAGVPRVKGWLAASVAVIDSAQFGGEGVTVGMGGGEVVYAGWIEFGGSRGRPLVPGGRYLTPTVLDSSDDAGQAVERATRDSIRRQAWPTPSL